MLIFCAWIFLIIVIGAFAFYRVEAPYWITGIGVLLLIYSVFGAMTIPGLTILWILWAVLAAILFFKPWRMQFITVPFLHWFRRQQPTLTKAEQQVLDAGGLWWEKQIFNGCPDWRELLKITNPIMRPDEQAFIDNEASHLCSLLDDWKIVNKNKDMSKAAWDYIKKEKFWSLIVDKKYGGRNYTAIAHSALVTKIASRSMSAAISIMVPNSLGPAELLMHYGTEEQRQHYLPRLAEGKEIPCFALTAPEAGSDATSIKDSGVICKGIFEEKEIIGIRLNFNKRYITLAPVATVIGLAFKLYDPDRLLGDKKNIGITLALIPADLPGVEKGKRHLPLHLGFMNGPIRGNDVFIPLDFIIGGVEKCGQGWKMLMECLAVGRGISLPSLATAATQVCFRTAGAYSVLRRQFKRSIGKFEGIQEALAAIGGYTYICNATRLFTAQAVEEGARPAVASAIAKYNMTELARKTIDHAMDIHAGRAIQMGPNNYLSNAYDGIPISITVEGANILTRNLIIFGQGAMRGHPFLRAELTVAEQPDNQDNQKEFDRLLLSHVGFIISRLARGFVYGITGGRLIQTKINSPVNRHYRQLTRMSCAFTLFTDLAMAVLGSQLKIRESLSARMGDILSHLYMASAVLKYFEDHGRLQEEVIFVDWSVTYCLAQVQTAIDNFVENFPVRWLAKILRWVVFPWGRSYYGPRDALHSKIAEFMQRDSKLRDRITSLCYFEKNEEDPIGRVESAFHKVLQTLPVMEKVRAAVREKRIDNPAADRLTLVEQAHAQGIINNDEFESVQDAEQARLAVLQVDEFEKL